VTSRPPPALALAVQARAGRPRRTGAGASPRAEAAKAHVSNAQHNAFRGLYHAFVTLIVRTPPSGFTPPGCAGAKPEGGVKNG